MVIRLPASGRQVPAVQFDSVDHRYQSQSSLSGVSFAVTAGELCCITGPSGAGKTTLLRLVHADERPAAGSVRVEGRKVPVGWGRAAHRRRVACVYQDLRLLSRHSALENVSYALRVSDLSLRRKEVASRAREALIEVGLGGRLDARPGELSGGQRQRLALARAIALRPTLLLADEPTANLDRKNARLVVDILRGAAAAGTTVLLATHDPEVPARGCDRWLELADGELVSDMRQHERALRDA